jgi:ribosome-associated heat shock protein Hsp15
VRIDKWLWAARFFKTRSLAIKSCELGRIQLNNQEVKPAKEIKPGDILQIKNDSGDFQVEVLTLSEMRGPAGTAQTLYRETEASKEARQKLIEDRRLLPYLEAMPSGKPNKRDRRELNRFRGR